MKMNRFLSTLLLPVFLVSPAICPAQLKSTVNDKTMTGRFFVTVDDEAYILVNGKEVHHGGLGESRSGEMVLKTGDRVVVHQHNHTAGHSFLMVFASTDGKSIVNFRSQDFRIVKDDAASDVRDFTPEQMAKWTKQPKGGRGKSALPVKNYSEWVWGDTEHCVIAGTVTAMMFSARPQ